MNLIGRFLDVLLGFSILILESLLVRTDEGGRRGKSFKRDAGWCNFIKVLPHDFRTFGLAKLEFSPVLRW